MKKAIALLPAALLAVSINATAGEGGPHQKYVKDVAGKRFSAYIGLDKFHWDEHDQGQKLLDEDGYLYDVGLQLDNFNMAERGTVYQFHVGYKGGKVDYDGQTQSGTPIDSKTKYENLYIEYNLGYRFLSSPGMSFDLLAGIGHEQWRRILQDTTTASGTPVFGYTEKWGVTYLKATAGVNFLSPRWAHHLHLGVKAPFVVKERVDIVNADLEPKGKPAGFAEWGSDFLDEKQRPLYGLTLYYEEATFDESAVSNGFYQPDSKRHETGARFHVYF